MYCLLNKLQYGNNRNMLLSNKNSLQIIHIILLESFVIVFLKIISSMHLFQL